MRTGNSKLHRGGWIRLVLFGLIFSLAGLGVFAPLVSAQEQDEDKAVLDCLVKGHEALAKRDLAAALQAFNGCVEKFPKSITARYWLAMACFYNKDATKAIDQFKEILRMDSKSIDAMAMLGRLYSFDKDKLNVAQEFLEKSVKARPDSMDIRFDLARVYALRGQMEKSFGEFAIIFDNEAKFPLYRTEFAKILIAGEAKDEAKMQLQRALTLDPQFEPAKQLIKQLEAGGASGPAPGAPSAPGPATK
jgi:tetratricopeptide (TPR) repeat protein